MDDHTKAEEFGTERAFSKLDWPTPEMLVSAHRVRARVLREMTVALGRKLGMLIKNRMFKSGLSHGGSDSAQENAHMTIASVAMFRNHAMFRNQMKRDIRTMQAGRDPAGLCRDAGVIPTYCSDTVVRLSLETNSATDRKLMSKTGRQLADGPAYVERERRAVSGPRQRRLGVTRPRTADCHSPSHPARTLAPKDCDMEDLIMAALSGDDVRVSQLLDAGADVNHADENGWTVLTSAAIARRTR